MKELITDREFIRVAAAAREEEHDSFRSFLQSADGDELDRKVFVLQENIAARIDCTKCGACCSQLMINVTREETVTISNHLDITPGEFIENYAEESLQGKLIINTIPCHFLAENKCTVYAARFNECREFPHLHTPNFKGRLFGTLIHYAMCPIIYNVIEELKHETGFLTLSTETNSSPEKAGEVL